MDNESNIADWHQFWEHTREMLNRGEIPGGEFYQKLTTQATSRAVTYEEFYYLLGRFPALVVRNTAVESFRYHHKPDIIKSRSHWDILDFGDVIATSPGRLLWGAYKADIEEDSKQQGAEGAGHFHPENSSSAAAQNIIKGTGTLVQQYVDAAYDVMTLAVEKGWPAAQIIHGFYGMIRAAWIAAQGLQFRLEGFMPTVNDQVVLTWVTQLLDKRQKEVAKRIKVARQQIDPSA